MTTFQVYVLIALGAIALALFLIAVTLRDMRTDALLERSRILRRENAKLEREIAEITESLPT